MKFPPPKMPNREALEFFAAKFPEMEITAVESTLTLLKVASLVFSGMECHFSRHNLSRGGFQAMMLLLRSADQGTSLNPAHMAEQMAITRATMTGLLDTLVAKGFVTREASAEDRRTVLVNITAAGRAHMQSMLPDHYRRASALMSGLTADDHQRFRDILEKVEAGILKVREP